MKTSENARQDSSGGGKPNEHHQANALGVSGGKNDSAKAWLNTPDAIAARIVLKEVLIEEMFPPEMIADLFERYELHSL